MKKSAFSLMEVLVAMAILGVAIVPALTMQLGGLKQSRQVSSVFQEAVLAQMIWENCKNRLEYNPYFLGRLSTDYGFRAQRRETTAGETLDTLELVGTVWEEERAPIDHDGRPIGTTFLTQFLVNTAGGALFSAGNRDLAPQGGGKVTPEDARSLLAKYKGLGYRVVMAPGPFGNLKKKDDRWIYEVTRNQYTRHVRIEIFTYVPGKPISEEPTYAVETVVPVPPESVDLPAFLAWQEEVNSLKAEAERRANTFMQIGWAATDLLLSSRTVQALSELSFIFSEVVGESMRISEDDLGFNVKGELKGYDAWITLLDPVDTPYTERQIAQLQEQKALTILHAFRRTEPSFHRIKEYTGWMRAMGEENLQKMERRLAEGLSPADLIAAARIEEAREAQILAQRRKAGQARDAEINAQAGDTKTDSIEGNTFRGLWEYLEELMFFNAFFREPHYDRAMERPLQWNDRFGQILQAALSHRGTLQRDERLTPLEKTSNLQQYIELCKSTKIFRQAESIPEEGLVDEAKVASSASFMPLAEYLAQDDLKDKESLNQRNAPYVRLLAGMRGLGGQGGVVTAILADIEALSKLESKLPELMTQLAFQQTGSGKTQRTAAENQDSTLGALQRLSDEAKSRAGRAKEGEQIVLEEEEGASPGLLALRELLVRSYEARNAGDLAGYKQRVQALLSGGGLTLEREQQMARLIVDNIDVRLQEMAKAG